MKKTNLFTSYFYLSLGLAALFVASVSQAKSPRSLAGLSMIKERQAVFVLIQSNFKFLGDVARNKVEASPQEIAKHANRLAYFSQLLNETFHPVSNLGEPHTKTTENVWREANAFNEMLTDFQRNTQQLALVATAENFEQKRFRQATGQLAKDCKACHKQYKVK
ncbi:hypothetical protein C2869_22050 (plasmid) [Saccharobesus litoralis]|uniref:Cytochrome c n=1 Tax=Saccharobesus litoralis TaxID=2172099 RepID=A0A2S0VY86_9ALTE|nr:cytochrome c [Saccharobesus litoralis]AWB69187.1 hypothetical protein C2869_22050 [Saccharobesus litoralis]